MLFSSRYPLYGSWRLFYSSAISPSHNIKFFAIFFSSRVLKQPLHQQLFSIHFEDDRLQIVAAGNICSIMSQLLVVRVIFSSSFLFSLVKSQQRKMLFSKCSAFFSGGSRLWDGGGGVPRKIFRPFGPQFRLKIRGNLPPPGPPLDPPLFSQYRVVVMMGSTRRNFKSAYKMQR